MAARLQVIRSHLSSPSVRGAVSQAWASHIVEKVNRFLELVLIVGPQGSSNLSAHIGRKDFGADLMMPVTQQFITGASRGIGLAIALRAARDGANVVCASLHGLTEGCCRKDDRSPSQAGRHDLHGGGRFAASSGMVDTQKSRRLAARRCHCSAMCGLKRFEARPRVIAQSVRAAVDAAVAKFGGIDILVNNASAINLAGAFAECARLTQTRRAWT